MIRLSLLASLIFNLTAVAMAQPNGGPAPAPNTAVPEIDINSTSLEASVQNLNTTSATGLSEGQSMIAGNGLSTISPISNSTLPGSAIAAFTGSGGSGGGGAGSGGFAPYNQGFPGF